VAALAAACFGVTAPVIERMGRGVGPLTTAALLYVGACASALFFRFVGRRGSGRAVTRADLPRLALVALSGAAIAPTLFAWGLQRMGALTASLLLNLEAAFTVLLAWMVFREPIGRRVAAALVLMMAAGVLLARDAAGSSHWSGLGLAAVVGATVAWALDNTLTRPLAEHDPLAIVAAKGALGAACTTLVALGRGEAFPSLPSALSLLVCGATGYGLSLRLYLLAQRAIGVGRTASVFALAPFVGAATAWLVGVRSAGVLTGASAVLFAVGVYLHLTERHRHAHRHLAVEHEHAHRHDDGHHTHRHDPPALGEHTHRHMHETLEHDHDHAPDVHHTHPHD
jgi:drug/metabolite transporter (DMT)-like permease